MPSTYSSLKFELIATGEQAGTWGNTTNINIGTAIEEAITGSATVTFTSGANTAIALTNTNAAQAARNLRLDLSGTMTTSQYLYVPAIEKFYIINNTLSNTVIVSNGSNAAATGTAVSVPRSTSVMLFNDGVNVTSAISHIPSLANVTITSGNATVTNLTATSANLTNANVTSVLTVAAGTNAAPSITFSGDTNTGIYSPGADTIAFTEGGVESMRIDSSGNVGIGTSTINTTLAVNGNALIGTGAWPTNDFGRSGSRFVNASSTEDGIFAIVNMQSGVAANRGGYLYLGARATTGVDGATFASIQGQRENATSGNYSSFLGFSTTSSIGVIGERARIDSSGNLGLGVTPSAWGASFKAIQLANGVSYASTNDPSLQITQNGYYDGTNWRFIANGYATNYQHSSGQHIWRVSSASGTAGNAITFTQAMTLDASGQLMVGTTTAADALTISSPDTDTRIYIQASDTGTGNTNGFMLGTISSLGYVWNYENQPILFGINSAERARLDSASLTLSAVRILISGASGIPAPVNNGDGNIGTATTNGLALIGKGSTNDIIFLNKDGNTAGRVATGATTITTSSDERLKENLVPIENAVDKVAQLRTVTGNYKSDPSRNVAFLIAQDVDAVFPQAVEKGDPEELGINYNWVIPLALAAIKEQQQMIDEMKAEIAALKGNA